MTARHQAPAAWLVAAGLAAAVLSLWTARGCLGSRRWPSWAASLIGVASAPQAAVSGFHAPYAIPDTATAVLGAVLTVAVLTTVGRTGQPGHFTENSCTSAAFFRRPVVTPRELEQLSPKNRSTK